MSAQRTWTITNLSLINYLPDSTNTTLLDIPNSAWLGVNMLNTTANWGVSTTSLKITGGAATAPSNESWVISQPINPSQVSPDNGVPIKNVSDNPVKNYPYVFTKSGVYTVTFDARNVNVYGNTKGIKTLTFTVK